MRTPGLSGDSTSFVPGECFREWTHPGVRWIVFICLEAKAERDDALKLLPFLTRLRRKTLWNPAVLQ